MKRQTGRGLAKRAVAAVAAIALAMLGATAMAAPASAAPANMPTGDGSLNIHKYQQPSPAGAANHDGSPITVPGGWVALDGVNFSIQRINDVDLTTDAGWALANTYAADPASATDLGAATNVVTSGGGLATAGLPIGAYLVTELASPGATAAGVPVTITTAVAPFVVTVPIPTGDGTWNSNVHVYPKNSVTTQPVKTVSEPDPPGLLGSVLTWTIQIVIPTLPPGESFTHFQIIDDLDEKISYVPGSFSATINGTSVTGGFTDNSPLDRTQVNVVVTDPSVLNGHGGDVLTVSFDTHVLGTCGAHSCGIGEIVNIGDVYINDPNHEHAIRTNPATSYWGGIKIIKHAEGDPTRTLEGARFEVYETEADALAGTNVLAEDVDHLITSNWSTGPDGTLTIWGLWVSNTAGETKTYWLRETQAPPGYQLITDPIPVTLTAGSDLATPVDILVPNPQKPQIELPLTGGAGTVTLTLIGASLIAAGGVLARVASRRRSGGAA